MTPEHKHHYLARITLQNVTPLSIAAGPADGVFDVALVRDANGLPALPGSSLAGVLRHLYRESHTDDATRELFGYQEKDKGDASPLHVSWGHIQDSEGTPVEGILWGKAAKRLNDDPLLKFARDTAEAPVLRDRVRISHRGAAAGTGKFDRAVLPAGFRFSAELSLWSTEANDSRWIRLLSLLHHPLLRLGGATRAGLGRVALVSAHGAHFDLSTGEGRKAFSELSRNVGAISELDDIGRGIEAPKAEGRFINATLKLTPNAFWRVGQGEAPTLTDANNKPADLLPKLEQRVVWNGKGEMAAAELLMPASSIKGALAHRLAFHFNRIKGHWAEDEDEIAAYDKSEHCGAVRTLFGFARDDRRDDDDGRDDGEARGRAGHLYLDDAYLTYEKSDLKLMMHNALDRFSGGVRDHVLFSEELVWGKKIELRMTVDTAGIDTDTRAALRMSLNDLCRGRLALGGGAAKGHGFFTGTVNWSDGGAWLAGGEAHNSEEEAA